MTNSITIDPRNKESEEVRAAREAVKQLNEEAAANWDDPAWRREVAQQMSETIFEGFEHENLLALMAEVENAGFNDRVFVKEVRGLRAFWLARGGHIEASTLRSQVMELPRDEIGFHVYEFEDKLRTNFAETQATLIDLGIQRMDAVVNQRVLSLFQSAITSSSDYYVSVSGLTLDSLNTALREVREESKSQEVVILGRATMTEQIMDALLGTDSNGAGFTPSMNEDMIRRGVLGVYRNATIVTLLNHKDDEDVSFFPGNELYVIARDASKMAFWGGLQAKEYVEQDNWYWHYIARRDFGGVVHRPERVRRIVDSNVAA